MVEAEHGSNCWARIDWSSLEFHKSSVVFSGDDRLDQYNQLKAWAESREQPIRNVVLEEILSSDGAANRERQRCRAILFSLPMLAIEAPTANEQRGIAHFIARVDELISEIVPLPPEIAEKVKHWQGDKEAVDGG